MKKSVYFLDLYLVAKYILFRYRAKIWGSLNIRAVNYRACVLGHYTELQKRSLG